MIDSNTTSTTRTLSEIHLGKEGPNRPGIRRIVAGFLRTPGLQRPLWVYPQAVRGSQASSALRLRVIGCGGRGNFVSDKFRRARTAGSSPWPTRSR